MGVADPDLQEREPNSLYKNTFPQIFFIITFLYSLYSHLAYSCTIVFIHPRGPNVIANTDGGVITPLDLPLDTNLPWHPTFRVKPLIIIGFIAC